MSLGIPSRRVAAGGSAAVATTLLVAMLSRCIGGATSDGAGTPQAAAPKPWEIGLAAYAETPDIVVAGSREDRRAAVTPPGFGGHAALDAAMEACMAPHGVPAASVAVLREGLPDYTL